MSERKKKENLDSRKKGAEAKEDEPLNWKRELVEWAKISVVAAVIAFFLNSCIIASSEVPSGFMEQTIMTGDRIVGSRLAYRFGSEPERGDIVISKRKSEPGKDKTRLVERIIGLPGEMVDIRDNHVYINGSEMPLEKPYLPEPMESDSYHFETSEGCCLMLGDNRNHSADARRWSGPYVSKEEILAKVLIKYSPGIRKTR